MKILVVDDNKKFARFVVRALAEEGYVVDHVGDGSTAVKQIQTVDYDVIVLDWILPEVDGIGVCRQLRTIGSQVPIMMLTARGEVSERIAGLDAGADDYLPKPFDLRELLARVRALARRSIGSDRVLRVGPLTLDLPERRAMLEGKRLDLTPREFALIAHLGREAGRTVPRTSLLAKVWETSFDPGSNVVEVNIRKVREKLGTHSTMIETVRGVGYRLAVPKA